MAYLDHFKLADDMIAHLNTVVHNISDPFISSQYVGFVAVASVTVYELAIKEIFVEFGKQKHKVLGTFTSLIFDRINGRIKYKTIKEEYIVKFGEKYLKRFKKNVQKEEQKYLRQNRVSIINSYNNIIEWRNQFAHEGTIPSTVTYDEVVQAYEFGKQVINCLAITMRR